MRGHVTDPSASDGLAFVDDLPEPDPGPDQVVLAVEAYAVNRGELFLLGQRDDGWRPGQDVAGTVVTAAADGSGPPVGTRIVGIVGGAGWGQRIAVDTVHLAVLPDDVTVEAAASLPIAGLTALRALRHGGLVLGRDVLVTGATGGVGQFAVQLARAAGARVTAQVSGPDREDEARAAGADAVTWDLADDDGTRFHLVLDGVGGDVLTAAVHRSVPGGTVVTYGSVGGTAGLALGDFGAAPNVEVVGFFHHAPEDTKGEDLAILVDEVTRGRLVPRLGRVEDWSATRTVLQALRDREVRGRAVLTVSDS